MLLQPVSIQFQPIIIIPTLIQFDFFLLPIRFNKSKRRYIIYFISFFNNAGVNAHKVYSNSSFYDDEPAE